MGNLKFRRSWANPAFVDRSFVDWSLGPFLAEQYFLDHFSMSQNNFIWVYINLDFEYRIFLG